MSADPFFGPHALVPPAGWSPAHDPLALIHQHISQQLAQVPARHARTELEKAADAFLAAPNSGPQHDRALADLKRAVKPED